MSIWAALIPAAINALGTGIGISQANRQANRTNDELMDAANSGLYNATSESSSSSIGQHYDPSAIKQAMAEQLKYLGNAADLFKPYVAAGQEMLPAQMAAVKKQMDMLSMLQAYTSNPEFTKSLNTSLPAYNIKIPGIS